MRIERDAAVLQQMERLERVSGRIAVRLRKGQPVTRSYGVGVSLSSPVMRPAADVAHLEARILARWVLDARVELQSVGCVGTCGLADAGNPQACSSKAVRIAGGKLVGVVQEAAIAVHGCETGNKRRVYAGRAVGHENVVTVVELAEPSANRPLARSRGIPGHTQARCEAETEVVLDSPVGAF